MPMEDQPQDILGLEIKAPTAGNPSSAIPDLGGDPTPPTPTELREQAEARAIEEGVKSAPVESSEARAIAPPPNNAAGMISEVAHKLEDWAQTVAGELAKALTEVKDLKAENSDLLRENRKMSEELSKLD